MTKTTTRGTRSHLLYGLTLGLALAVMTAAVAGPGTAGTEAEELTPWSAADEAGVRAAVEDYLLGVYEVSPERIERSVHPEMHKLGYARQNGTYRAIPMSFDELVALAGSYNAEGRIPEDAPREIEVLDVLDKTATAKLTAIWGVDYFHLARLDGQWMIMNVLWQSHPPESERE